MSDFSPRSVKTWIKETFPHLRKTRSVNLALAVFGMVKTRSGIISELVRDLQIPGSDKHKHRRKRVDRFLSNSKFNPEKLFKLLIGWVLATLVKGKYIPIAIDWTTLPGSRQCLMAAIPFMGRGIPIIWRLLAAWEDITDSLNRIEERFITR